MNISSVIGHIEHIHCHRHRCHDCFVVISIIVTTTSVTGRHDCFFVISITIDFVNYIRFISHTGRSSSTGHKFKPGLSSFSQLPSGFFVFPDFWLSGFLASLVSGFLAFCQAARKFLAPPQLYHHANGQTSNTPWATHRSVSSLSFSPSQYLCYLYRYDILSATLGLKMSLSIGSQSVGYWLWDEPTDDPPPCPHPALVLIPHRPCLPLNISLPLKSLVRGTSPFLPLNLALSLPIRPSGMDGPSPGA